MLTYLTKLAALGGVLLTLLSAYPGILLDFLLIAIVLSPIWLFALLVISGVTIPVIQARRAKEKPRGSDLDLSDEDIGASKWPASPRRGLIVNSSVLVVCLALVPTGTPRRIAFAFSRSAFQRYVSTAPASEFEGEPLGRFLGVYYVDRYGADPRGGVYFRTHAGADGIGPDTMSYGFAFRPNPEGTPFGRAGYRYSHVIGDWYVFSASDDY